MSLRSRSARRRWWLLLALASACSSPVTTSTPESAPTSVGSSPTAGREDGELECDRPQQVTGTPNPEQEGSSTDVEALNAALNLPIFGARFGTSAQPALQRVNDGWWIWRRQERETVFIFNKSGRMEASIEIVLLAKGRWAFEGYELCPSA